MPKNKIVFGNTTLIDLTDATIGANDSSKIIVGETAYGKDGSKITGTGVLATATVSGTTLTLTDGFPVSV